MTKEEMVWEINNLIEECSNRARRLISYQRALNNFKYNIKSIESLNENGMDGYYTHQMESLKMWKNIIDNN